MQNKLYVGNLGLNLTRDDLISLLSAHGQVVEAKLIEGKGFGFVEMSNQQEAESARKALSGTTFKGKILKIDIAVPVKSKFRHRH